MGVNVFVFLELFHETLEKLEVFLWSGGVSRVSFPLLLAKPSTK